MNKSNCWMLHKKSIFIAELFLEYKKIVFGTFLRVFVVDGCGVVEYTSFRLCMWTANAILLILLR